MKFKFSPVLQGVAKSLLNYVSLAMPMVCLARRVGPAVAAVEDRQAPLLARMGCLCWARRSPSAAAASACASAAGTTLPAVAAIAACNRPGERAVAVVAATAASANSAAAAVALAVACSAGDGVVAEVAFAAAV